MQLNQDENEVVGPREGLSALADQWRIGRGGLSLLPTEDADDHGHAAAKTWAKSIPASTRAALLSALRVAGEPAQVGLLHYTLGDDHFAKASLAWGADAEAPVVVISGSGDDCALRWREPHWLSSHITDVLAMGTGASTMKTVGVPLSPAALLTLVAITEVYREGRLLAQLAHAESLDTFVEEDVLAFLRDDDLADDHRRPLCFLSRLLPAPLTSLELWNDREDAFRELEARALISPVARATDSPQRWRLTAAGREIERALWHNVAKVGARVSRPRAGGALEHEVFSLIRSFRSTWLLNLSGRDAIITSVDPQTLAAFLDEALALRVAPPEPVAPIAAAPVVREVPCPTCGAFLPEDKKFCGDCGAAVSGGRPVKTEPRAAERQAQPAVSAPAEPAFTPQACSVCGAHLTSGARFCRQCGTPR